MNFETDVIQRSHEIPVVVDFWAPWCGPCQVLGPTIEQLAAEQEGRWTLVKLNTEEHQDIARQYRVMSIPNVKLFRNGEAVAEFVGALPKSAIEKWLDEHIQSEDQLAFDQLVAQTKQVPDPDLLPQLASYYQIYPNQEAVQVAYAKHLVFSKPTEARKIVEPISLSSEVQEEAADIRQVAGFLEADLIEEKPVVNTLAEAQRALRESDFKRTIELLIQATIADKSYGDDLPRKTTIALFRLWGAQHPLTKYYRPRFDMALY
jgi:putative thioredoxin